MADENIDVRFIGEQLARVLNELGEVRQELAAVHSGQNEIAVEVAVLGANVRDVKETLNIIEHDISAFPFRARKFASECGSARPAARADVNRGSGSHHGKKHKSFDLTEWALCDFRNASSYFAFCGSRA